MGDIIKAIAPNLDTKNHFPDGGEVNHRGSIFLAQHHFNEEFFYFRELSGGEDGFIHQDRIEVQAADAREEDEEALEVGAQELIVACQTGNG